MRLMHDASMTDIIRRRLPTTLLRCHRSMRDNPRYPGCPRRLSKNVQSITNPPLDTWMWTKTTMMRLKITSRLFPSPSVEALAIPLPMALLMPRCLSSKSLRESRSRGDSCLLWYFLFGYPLLDNDMDEIHASRLRNMFLSHVKISFFASGFNCCATSEYQHWFSWSL
jgi:hypothetical protein